LLWQCLQPVGRPDDIRRSGSLISQPTSKTAGDFVAVFKMLHEFGDVDLATRR
jgi:hypothetical protein